MAVKGAYNFTRWLCASADLALAGTIFLAPCSSPAAVTFSTQHNTAVDAFDGVLSSTDLIHDRGTLDTDVFENPMDTNGNPSIGVDSWHPANTNLLDRHAAFTDGEGIRSTGPLPLGLTGLLNDNFPTAMAPGRAAKIVQYSFSEVGGVDIGRINILSGSNDPDGRVFSTTWVEYSIDNGFNFNTLGYFQSDPSGTGNSTERSTLVSIFDDSVSTMLSGVTDLIFNLYSVSNTAGRMDDPYDGVNPFTGLDDGFAAAFQSPLILEIDVLAPVEGLPGDFNEDNKVDAADYAIFRKSVGMTSTLPNDPDVGTDVDDDQYNTWVQHFGEMANNGSGAGGESAVGVPEPNTVAMLVAIVGIAFVQRTRVNSRAN
jgi:hypothetical protein